MSGGASAWGIRSLADGFFRYWQPGQATYLRLQNNTDASTTASYGQLGFVPAVSGAQPGQSGFNDILINPPADTVDVSLHNIGMSGGRLQFGAKIFTISHTFVLQQMALRNLTDDHLVWRAPEVIGLYQNNRIYTIESITDETIGSDKTLWKLMCNRMEFPTSPST